MTYFKLDNSSRPVTVAETSSALEDWDRDYKATDPVIARDVIDGVAVETFFRGYDHNAFRGEKEPELWRTRIVPVDDTVEDFDPTLYPQQLRYTSVEAALAGHDEAVAKMPGGKR